MTSYTATQVEWARNTFKKKRKRLTQEMTEVIVILSNALSESEAQVASLQKKLWEINQLSKI